MYSVLTYPMPHSMVTIRVPSVIVMRQCWYGKLSKKEGHTREELLGKQYDGSLAGEMYLVSLKFIWMNAAQQMVRL